MSSLRIPPRPSFHTIAPTRTPIQQPVAPSVQFSGGDSDIDGSLRAPSPLMRWLPKIILLLALPLATDSLGLTDFFKPSEGGNAISRPALPYPKNAADPLFDGSLVPVETNPGQPQQYKLSGQLQKFEIGTLDMPLNQYYIDAHGHRFIILTDSNRYEEMDRLVGTGVRAIVQNPNSNNNGETPAWVVNLNTIERLSP